MTVSYVLGQRTLSKTVSGEVCWSTTYKTVNTVRYYFGFGKWTLYLYLLNLACFEDLLLLFFFFFFFKLLILFWKLILPETNCLRNSKIALILAGHEVFRTKIKLRIHEHDEWGSKVGKVQTLGSQEHGDHFVKRSFC